MALPAAYQALLTLPRSLWTIAAANFINRCGAMVLAFLTVYYIKVLHLPLHTAGLLTACYSWGSLLAAPWSARLCRSHDSVHVMVFSLLSSGTLMILYPQVENPYALAPLTFAIGCLAELCRPAGYTSINQLSPDEQKRSAFTLHRLAVNLGMSVGPALGGVLAAFSYHWLFWGDGATSIIAGLVLLLGRVRAGQPVANLSEEARVLTDQPFDRNFYHFMAAHFLGMMVFCQLFAGLPVYVVKILGRPEIDMGLLFTLNTMIILFCEATLNHRTSHWPLARALSLGNLGLGLGLGCLALHQSYACVVVGVLIFTAGEMLQAAAGPAYLGRSINSERLPRAHAWFVGAGSLSFIISPPLAATMLESFGGPGLWSLVGTMGLASALLMRTLPEVAHERK